MMVRFPSHPRIRATVNNSGGVERGKVEGWYVDGELWEYDEEADKTGEGEAEEVAEEEGRGEDTWGSLMRVALERAVFQRALEEGPPR